MGVRRWMSATRLTEQMRTWLNLSKLGNSGVKANDTAAACGSKLLGKCAEGSPRCSAMLLTAASRFGKLNKAPRPLESSNLDEIVEEPPVKAPWYFRRDFRSVVQMNACTTVNGRQLSGDVPISTTINSEWFERRKSANQYAPSTLAKWHDLHVNKAIQTDITLVESKSKLLPHIRRVFCLVVLQCMPIIILIYMLTNWLFKQQTRGHVLEWLLSMPAECINAMARSARRGPHLSNISGSSQKS